MTNGNFHDPYNGETFSGQISIGSYDVTNDDHILTYETVPEDVVSHCTCPICSKSFEVNLQAGKDAQVRLDFNDGYNSIHIVMGVV